MPETQVKVSFASDSKKIAVQFEHFTVIADGGDRTEPSPGALFVAGLLACTASTARGYCLRNGLPFPAGLEAKVRYNDQTGLVEHVEMNLLVPSEFPEEKLEALERAAGTCTVKKYWQTPPEFALRTSVLA
jgi:uncharacterized OsmC-like protein